ncbi:MAG: hypothetical protein AAF658_20175, partial [Myxococcota bacterium]
MRAWRFGPIVGFLCAAGCSAGQLEAPPRPAPSLSPPVESVVDAPLAATITTFAIHGVRPSDDPNAWPTLGQRFGEYLVAESPLARVDFLPGAQGRALPRTALRLEARIVVDRTDRHTVILDLWSVLFLGALTPWWGHLDGRIEVEVFDGSGEKVATLVHEDRVDFNQILFSWFGTDFVEGAYTALYELLFRGAAASLEDHWVSFGPDGGETLSVDPLLALHRSDLEAARARWDEQRLRVITEVPPLPKQNLFWKVARALGGI